MCPALILATNRTVKVKGRIIILIVSIITKNGISRIGAPMGAKWAIDAFGFIIHPESKSIIHINKARELLNHRLEVTP